MAWFAIGVFVGGLFTMLLMALFSLGSDREIEQRKREKDPQNGNQQQNRGNVQNEQQRKQGKKKDGDDDGESK